jgi:hypothetical protein
MTTPQALIIGLLSATVSNATSLWAAQEPQAPAAVDVKQPKTPTPPPATVTVPPGIAAGKGPNVRVELTLSDQKTGVPTVTKTVMLTTSNQRWGRLRTEVRSVVYGAAPLNVDAKPDVLPDGRIALEITIEYAQGQKPDAEGNTDRISMAALNESLSVLLDSGKSLLVTQSADPISDRKVTVEVKATVVR